MTDPAPKKTIIPVLGAAPDGTLGIAELEVPAPLPAPLPAPPSSALADREYALEIRRGLLIIMRATMRRFRVTWKDFLPPGMAVIEVGE